MENICDMSRVMCFILAGGRGSRLKRLTDHRAKPAVPFGSKYRIIDFPLCNAINSGIMNTVVLTQYKSDDLNDHLYDLNSANASYNIRPIPAQQLTGSGWYEGTADAVYQNHRRISKNVNIDTIVILAGDHICKFDIRKLFSFHKEKGSGFTVCGLEMLSSEVSGNFGVMEIDEHSKIISFEEKPEKPKEISDKEGYCCISTGIYMIDKQLLLELLGQDHMDQSSSHDFGNDIIPKAINENAVHFFDMEKSKAVGEENIFWRDVGRIKTYHEAQMELVSPEPQINLYNRLWHLTTIHDTRAPWKCIHPDKRAYIKEFLFGDSADEFFSEKRNKDEFLDFFENKIPLLDVIAAGGTVFDSPRIITHVVAGRDVRIEWGVGIKNTVLFDRSCVGPRVDIKDTIIEQDISIPENTVIGYDIKDDEERDVYVDKESGIRIVTDASHFD